MAVNAGASRVVVQASPDEVLERESNATSEGELTRVGTWPLGGLAESAGKTR